MKSKSISFAQVLKKNVRSPKVELSRPSFKLSELVQQFDSNPDEDYTLYLGQIGMSHKSKPSPFQMTFSKNPTDNQEEMFDSWIQKQSTLGPNKENIRNQSRVNPNQPMKRFQGSNKFEVGHQKVRQNGNPLSIYTSRGQRQVRPLEQSQSQSNFNQLNIQMIKSNHYEHDQFSKAKSPKVEVKTNHYQVRNPFIETDGGKRQKEDLSRHKDTLNKKEERQPQQLNSVDMRAAEQQISDIVSKYKDESDQQKEQQMLLVQSTDKQEDLLLAQTHKNQEADNLLKQRLENAKNILGNYFQKIKKGKEGEREVRVQKQKENREQNDSSHLVGYSFSTNYLPEQMEDNNHNERHLEEIVSEVANESEESESNFRRKYLNLTSFEAPPKNQAKNAESVKFSSQSGSSDQLYGIPYGSITAKLIKSNDRHPNQDSQCRQQQNKAAFSPKEQTKDASSNHIEPFCKGSKNKQKISLISSKSKSNKRSPTSIKEKQNQAPPTTDFTITQKTITKPQQSSTETTLKNQAIKEQIVYNKIQPTKQQNAPYAIASSNNNNNNTKVSVEYYSTTNYSKPSTSPYYATSNQSQTGPSYTSQKTEYVPLKIETAYTLDYSKREGKKQPTYAVPTYQVKKCNTYVSERQAKGNYFSKLDIKESINMEEDKTKREPSYSYKNSYVAYNNEIKQYKTGFVPLPKTQYNFMGQSLKKSINVEQSGEFTFDL